MFTLWASVSSLPPCRITIAQVADLLAVVAIESAVVVQCSENCSELVDNNDTERILSSLSTQFDAFPLASLAVASRIFELLNGEGGYSEKLIITLIYRWTNRLIELCPRQFPQDFSVGGSKPGAAPLLLAGALEHYRRRDNRELYWTITALASIAKFVLAIPSLCVYENGNDNPQASETLHGSLLVYATQYWTTSRR